MKHGHRNILIALAGQPNGGKSTIFNMLTGARQHVANFPGVTVEKKTGYYRSGESKVEIADLPGTYSMTSYTQEERIARDFILLEQPEVVVAVVDASNLERHLYFVFQLREMGMPLVLCLNMMDVARRRGFRIDVERLSAALGIPVVPTVANKGRGRQELKDAILRTCETTDHHPGPWRLDYGERLEPVLRRLEEEIGRHEHLTEDFPARWLAVKLMENDSEARRIILHHTHDGSGPALIETVDRERRAFLDEHRKAPEKIIAAQRYRDAARIVGESVDRKKALSRTLTDRIDTIVLHRLLAPVILVTILLLFYQVIMVYGTRLADWCFPYIGWIRGAVGELFVTSDPLRDGLVQSLLADGLAGGIVAILYYVPIFLVLFASVAILEDTGYMARIAFIMDRLLRGFGLHGQSTLPMILGGVIVGGCAIPGVMATRAMKDEKARLVTILIMPLMNCMAKIPFYVLIVGLLFPAGAAVRLLGIPIGKQGLALFGLSVFSFIVALLVAKFFSRFLVTGENAPFVMELPAYHVPTLGGVLRRTVERVWLFFKKIVTVVATVQVLVWFFVMFPGIGTEGEVRYDRLMQAAQVEMLRTVGPESRYARGLQGDDLIALTRFQKRYKKARRAAGEDASELLRVAREFDAENHDSFLIANGGRDVDGREAKGARKAAGALKKFLKSAKKLRRERKTELIATSYGGRIGKKLEPVSQLAGFNWRINIAIISSFAAKESMVGTLGTIYSVEEEEAGALSESMRAAETGWTRWHKWAILVFIALFPPCIATLIMIRFETGTYKWMFFAAVYPIILGFILAVIVLQLGTLVFPGGG